MALAPDSASNPLQLALALVENTGANLFLTGRAGTGKTTLLRKLRERTAKRVVVVAPTGIAAINAGGVTIHSFFQLPPAPFVPGAPMLRSFHFSKEKRRIIRALDLLIIDEVSMVRADLLDAMDAVLRRYRDRSRPFGGVQLLLVGDLQQLAPVARDDVWELLSPHYPSPFFFESHALRQAGFETIELHDVFRQTDAEFLALLNDVRSGYPSELTLKKLNERVAADFRPAKGSDYVRLTTHNAQARDVNRNQLDAIPGEAHTLAAQVEGDFPESMYPTDAALTLKVGAQVMFVKNDSTGMGNYYNGLIGCVCDISDSFITVQPREADHTIRVARETWDNVRYITSDDAENPENPEIKEEVIGSFRQFPLRTAWAITIHKSQGLTFSHAIIDASHAFAPGQTYVALSRCRSLEGLVLNAPITRRCIMADQAVEDFMRTCTQRVLTPQRIHQLEREFTLSQIDALFSIRSLADELRELGRLVDEFIEHSDPAFAAAWRQMERQFAQDDVEVAERFARQYSRLEGDALQTRVQQGAAYFRTRLRPAIELIESFPLEHSNAAVERRMRRAVGETSQQFALADSLLGVFADKMPFTPRNYLRAKLKHTCPVADLAEARPRKNTGDQPPCDPKLLRALQTWRTNCLREGSIKRSHLPTAAQLRKIAALRPLSLFQLGSIPGIGKAKTASSGAAIIEIIKEFELQ